MKKSTLVFMALLFLVNLSFARKGKKDVIYLKNGSVINGQIISSLPSGQVKIKTKDNSLWVFEASQIDSISKTANAFNQIRTGYFNLTEAGILAGNSNNKYSSPFSLMNISGWQFKNRFSVGAGAGVEFFSETYLPVVADFRYYLKRQGLNPFFGLQGGYSFALDTPDKQYVYGNTDIWRNPSGQSLDMKAKGGLMVNPSVGICTPLGDNLALTFSAGYRIMRHRYCREDNYDIDIDYNRLSLKIGLIFQ
ncbi:MAG: hypothetical protein GZ094_17360 [Mariniphaga sp.]|nr:hypothetical protein [Mariniphaga sp.]